MAETEPKIVIQPEAMAADAASVSQLLFMFLNSDAGKATAEEVAKGVGAFRAGFENSHKVKMFDVKARWALIAATLIAGVFLQYFSKLDAVAVGFLSGALGYFFGRQHKDE